MIMEIPDIVKHPINSLEIRTSWVGERFAEECIRHATRPDNSSLWRVGDHDGLYDDPVSAGLTESLGARVVLVEPQATLADGLHSRFPEARIVNAAVGKSSGSGTLYSASFRRNPNDVHGSAIACFDKHQVEREAERHGLQGSFELVREEVEIITPKQLLVRAARHVEPESMGALIVDVEGMDSFVVSEILKVLYERKIPGPPLIMWEALHVDPAEADGLKLRLSEDGYRVLKLSGGKDILCLRRDHFNAAELGRIGGLACKSFFSKA
jgi:hypothetical protein